MQHIGFAVSNAASSLILSLGLGGFSEVPGDNLSRPYFRALNRLTAAFALLADLNMMLLGGKLKRRERLSARLGDALSHLYLASAALKRYHDLDYPAHSRPLLCWAMEESLGHAEQALDELLSNFPSKLLGYALRVLVFPFGRRHKGPSDAQDAQVAEILGRNSGDPALEELLAGCYRPQAENDPVAALQQAMDLLQGAQPLQKKLDEALRKGRVQEVPGQSPIDAAVGAGVLSAEEAQSLHQAETARRVVIDVDDFAKEELKLGRGKVR
ncbi:Acyl-coenzyme A dehydrogenase [compost metagenome]